jgi:hypothetical protein
MDVSTLGTVAYPIVMLLSTVGLAAYGLFLVRNRQVREDGGLAGKPKTARVR